MYQIKFEEFVATCRPIEPSVAISLAKIGVLTRPIQPSELHHQLTMIMAFIQEGLHSLKKNNVPYLLKNEVEDGKQRVSLEALAKLIATEPDLIVAIFEGIATRVHEDLAFISNKTNGVH